MVYDKLILLYTAGKATTAFSPSCRNREAPGRKARECAVEDAMISVEDIGRDALDIVKKEVGF